MKRIGNGGNAGALDPDRRRFLAGLSVAAGTIAALVVAAPSITFLLGLREAPNEWRRVGRLDEYLPGTTVKVAFLDPSPLPWAGITARTAAWLRRSGEREFTAFSINCTHLGCPLRWLPEADLFLCPCHGGVFYKDGRVASGPPPKSLIRYPVRVRDGWVEILTSPIPIT
jgi:menaquinol-cytochrome c reductase iron-sulfur subunit